MKFLILKKIYITIPIHF